MDSDGFSREGWRSRVTARPPAAAWHTRIHLELPFERLHQARRYGALAAQQGFEVAYLSGEAESCTNRGSREGLSSPGQARQSALP